MPNPSAESKSLSLDTAPPVGSILPWHPRLFSDSNNGTVDSLDRITLGACYEECDGTTVPIGSPLRNSGFVYKPNINNNTFLMGGSSVSLLGEDYVYGGSNHFGPPAAANNNSNNSITISDDSLPPHIHEKGTIGVSTMSGTTSSDGNHGHHITGNHDYNGDNNAGGGWLTGTTPSDPRDYDTDAAGTHSHTVTVGGGVISGSTADGGFSNNPINILPKYLIVKFIMRVI